MNKKFLTLIVVLLFGLVSVNAQNYSTHQVKEGESVEGIAKHYHVKSSDIYALNPDAKKALKPNTILIIPIGKANPPKTGTETSTPVSSMKIEEVKELQGFKKHKVKRKETLYSLSKKYNVTIDEIKKYNTSLYASNLRKGDKIQIPVFTVKEVEVEKHKTYKVLPKEGKWRIAYKFGISIEELEALNPDMAEVLQAGQEIKVPNIGKEKEKVVDEKYSYYKVLPKEGFYRLKLKLGIEQDALETLNPELKEGGLKAGMILKIPFSETAELVQGEMTQVDLTKTITDFNEKHIALMLPFRLNQVDFDSIPDTKESIEKDPYLDASLDFYTGILVAVDSLKQLGVSLKMDVYDTKRETAAVTRILNENDFENLDAVIGPLTTKPFDVVSKELKMQNVPIVSPIGTNIKLYDNVFQSRPSDDLLKTRIINFVKSDSLPKHIVIIADTKHTTLAEELKREFNVTKIVYSRKNKKGKDENYVLVDDIKNALKPGRNYVFLETQNEGYASNVTSILASLSKKDSEKKGYKITLTTTHFNRAFQGDEVDNSHLSKLNFHFVTPSKSYNDYYNSFVKRYKKRYNITPNMRAVKGFDLMMDTVLRLTTSENLFTSVNTAPLTAYTENKFSYKKKLFGGYYNDAVYLVKYNNLNIVEVKQ